MREHGEARAKLVCVSTFLRYSLTKNVNLLIANVPTWLLALGCVYSFLKLKQQPTGQYDNSLFTVIYVLDPPHPTVVE